MNIEKELYDRATEFVKRRYPKGWGGAAILYTTDGSFLISVALECGNGSAGLCMETGAMCEAQRDNKRVSHSLCVVREDENSEFIVLTPCGICQERLLYWGEGVKAGITSETGKLEFKALKEIQPYSWTKAYGDELEHFVDLGLK